MPSVPCLVSVPTLGQIRYNTNIINVGVDEGTSRIQAWLSPLKLDRRHGDVSRSRMDGVRHWVLQRKEFRLWYESQDGTEDPTMLCYGGQGVGKTFIRYHIIWDFKGNADRGRN